MNTTIWLVRREFWENRAIWMIPAALGAVLILASLFGRLDPMTDGAHLPPRAVGQLFLVSVAGTFFAVMSIYSTWYLLDCLYADRKDRSILFWKSLPISDTKTVLSKALTAMVVIPLVYFAAADGTSLLMAFIVSVRASSALGGALWNLDLWLQLQAVWIYVIVIAAIWYLPIAAYLMVISAWARRAVMLWSILPPIALILAERWFFGTHLIANELGSRLLGLPAVAFHAHPGDKFWVSTLVNDEIIRTPANFWGFLDVSGFFSRPATWAGAAVGAALIIGAVQLRTRRTEI